MVVVVDVVDCPKITEGKLLENRVQTPKLSCLLLRFIQPPALQTTIRLHLLTVVVNVTEAGSVVVDVPSHHHISLSVADLNARSAIILAIMLISATIVMIILLLPPYNSQAKANSN